MTDTKDDDCGYESCMNTTSDSNSVTFDNTYTFTFAVDCKHLLPCGKCDLSEEDCPEHNKKTKVLPYNPWRSPYYEPYPYYPRRPWYPTRITNTGSNNYW